MKKNLKSILMLAALLMAGAATTSCSNDEEVNEPAVKTYHMSINVTKGSDALTRALSLDGTTLNASWAKDDKVYVFNGDKKTACGGYLEAQSDGASTTLDGTLTGTIEVGDMIVLFYPYPGTDGWDFTGQDGTLATIATKYDTSVGYAQVKSVSGGTITAAGPSDVPVIFENGGAIVKFTLLNKADDTPINATSLIISAKDGSDNEMLIQKQPIDMEAKITCGPIDITPASATNVLFAALCPDYGGLTDPIPYNYTLTASVGTDTYTCTATGVKLEFGKYYDITVKMTKL